jgi:hypothetical protein
MDENGVARVSKCTYLQQRKALKLSKLESTTADATHRLLAKGGQKCSPRQLTVGKLVSLRSAMCAA